MLGKLVLCIWTLLGEGKGTGKISLNHGSGSTILVFVFNCDKISELLISGSGYSRSAKYNEKSYLGKIGHQTKKRKYRFS